MEQDTTPHWGSEATHIEVEAEVRYWEDATVDGVEDSDGTLIPGRDGDLWKIRLGLADGRIDGWPDGVAASIHYKVCDQGEYWLTDRDGKRIAKWKGHYVPNDFLCHGDRGFGDYIIMEIAGGGRVAGYERPRVTDEEWAPIPAATFSAPPR